MNKNLLQIYSLLICLISSIILIITLGFVFRSTVNLIFLEYRFRDNLQHYSSNERYIEHNKDSSDSLRNLSADAIQNVRLHKRAEHIDFQKHQAINHIIDCVGWILISIAFFSLHWRLYKNATKSHS